MNRLLQDTLPVFRRSFAACGLLLAAILTGCAGSADRPTLRIATDATFAPFHFVTDTGGVRGFDVELASELARRAGFNPIVDVLSYEALFSALSSGGHDVVAATTGITAERRTRFAFSRPYFDTCQVAVVRSGDGEPQRLAGLSGLRVAATGSGTAAAAMRSLESSRQQKIEDGEGVALLKARRIDAWIVDEFDALSVVRASGGALRVLPDAVARESYGFVFALHNLRLVDAFNNALLALESEGFLERLKRKHGLDRSEDWPVRCR